MDSLLKLQTARSRSTNALEEELLLIWNNHAERIQPFHRTCISTLKSCTKTERNKKGTISSCRNESYSVNDFA